MRMLLGAITMATLLAFGSPSAELQAQAPLTASVLAVQAVDEPSAASVQSGTTSGLPTRTPPPRTMSDRWPVFVLFTIIWLALVAYTLSFNGRLKRIAAGLTEHGSRADQRERTTLP